MLMQHVFLWHTLFTFYHDSERICNTMIISNITINPHYCLFGYFLFAQWFFCCENTIRNACPFFYKHCAFFCCHNSYCFICLTSWAKIRYYFRTGKQINTFNISNFKKIYFLKFFIRLRFINKNNLEIVSEMLIFEVGRSLDAVDNCGTEMNDKKKAHHPHGQCAFAMCFIICVNLF